MNNQPEIESTVPKTESLKSGRGSSGRVFLFVLLLILAVLITALATFSYTINEFCHVADENSVKLQTITKLLEERAYYDADYDEMLDAALKAYVGAAGDKYTTYYTAEEYAALSHKMKEITLGSVLRSKRQRWNIWGAKWMCLRSFASHRILPLQAVECW